MFQPHLMGSEPTFLPGAGGGLGQDQSQVLLCCSPGLQQGKHRDTIIYVVLWYLTTRKLRDSPWF